jgi:putative hydrolase of the HAD superfamily
MDDTCHAWYVSATQGEYRSPDSAVTKPIRAITFDLWDTIVWDDSDEPKRRMQGLRSKKDERRHILWQALNQQEPIAREHVNLAYDVADAAFNSVWHDQHVTWDIGTRLRVILRGLGRQLADDTLAEVIRKHQRMEVEIFPDLVSGCAKALEQLAEKFKLAVVSDAVVTPGRCLRELLELHRVRQFFSGFAFSDEVGRSKPHREMFNAAARELGVRVDQMIHIGDRDHNDIRGPHALGMKAVLFTACRATDREHTHADAICERYEDLPAIIDLLAP